MSHAQRQFEWLIAPLEEFGAKPLQCYSSPATVASRLGTKVAANLARHCQDKDAMRVWADLLGVIPDDTWANGPRLADEQHRAARRRARATPAGRAALAIVDAAHDAVPFSPIFVLSDPVVRSTTLLDTLGTLRDAKARRGEPRVRRISEVAARVADPLYREHVERLWRLSRYAQGGVPGKPPHFGVAIQQIGLPPEVRSALVDLDVPRTRNAVAHGKTRYDPATRAMHLRGRSGLEWTMSGRDLEKLVERMLRQENALCWVLAEFAQWSLITHMAPTVGRLVIALRNRDEAALSAVGIEYQAQMDALLRPCGTLHRSPAVPRAKMLAN